MFLQDFLSQKIDHIFNRATSLKSSWNLIKIKLEIMHTINFTGNFLQVCSYKYLLRYNDVKSSKGFLNHLNKTRGIS